MILIAIKEPVTYEPGLSDCIIKKKIEKYQEVLRDKNCLFN